MLGKSKFNSIEILISQILIDLEISHKEFKKIVNEKGKYRKLEWWKVMMKYELNEYKTINRENQENAWNWKYDVFITYKISEISVEAYTKHHVIKVN